jgi:two-component sensor histidine kinase
VELTKILKPDIAAPRIARIAVDDLSDRLPAGIYRDLQVVLTELVTNAIRYGPAEDIRVWLFVSAGGTVRGEVADGGTGGAAIDRERSVDDGGLGLQIVDALCSAWCNPAGTGRIWFALETPAIV